MTIYLLIVKYSSEAERKRLEYLLEQYEGKMYLRKPSGSIIMIEGDEDNIKNFLEELYSKIPREEVEIYKIMEPDIDIEAKSVIIELHTTMGKEEALGAIGMALASMRGILVSEAGGERTYILSLKGGRVNVKVRTVERGPHTLVLIELEGYGRIFNRAKNNLLNKLSLIGEVKIREL